MVSVKSIPNSSVLFLMLLHIDRKLHYKIEVHVQFLNYDKLWSHLLTWCAISADSGVRKNSQSKTRYYHLLVKEFLIGMSAAV